MDLVDGGSAPVLYVSGDGSCNVGCSFEAVDVDVSLGNFCEPFAT